MKFLKILSRAASVAPVKAPAPNAEADDESETSVGEAAASTRPTPRPPPRDSRKSPLGHTSVDLVRQFISGLSFPGDFTPDGRGQWVVNAHIKAFSPTSGFN